VDELAPPVARVGVRAASATIVFAAVALFAVRAAEPVLAPVLGSILLAYALAPFVAAGERCRLRRPMAVLCVYLVLALLAWSVVRIGRAQIGAFVEELPATAAAASGALRGASAAPNARAPLEPLRRAAADLQAAADAAAGPSQTDARRVTPVAAPFDVRAYLAAIGSTAAAATMQAVVVIVLTAVLLLAGDRMKHKCIALGGRGLERRRITRDVIRAIDRQIERYLVARVLVSVIVAAATAAGMWAVGVDQPLALGAIAGVLNVLPFIGPTIGVAICALVAFTNLHTGAAALAAAVASGAVAAIEGNLISPWLTGRAGELNTVAVFVSVLFWGWMWDVWGLVLAVPIVVSVKAAADHIEALHPIGELLGR
jgi:predicted PurR-regulated permease PerM